MRILFITTDVETQRWRISANSPRRGELLLRRLYVRQCVLITGSWRTATHTRGNFAVDCCGALKSSIKILGFLFVFKLLSQFMQIPVLFFFRDSNWVIISSQREYVAQLPSHNLNKSWKILLAFFARNLLHIYKLIPWPAPAHNHLHGC